MIAMRYTCQLFAIVLAVVLLGACSEPEDSITRSTPDGKFSLTLEAKQNWVRYGDVLPIKVIVTSLTSERVETVDTAIMFETNNGSVQPSGLDFTFPGTADSLAVSVTEHSLWVFFEATSARNASSDQAEIYALLGDSHAPGITMAELKIRLVAKPE